MFEYYCLVNKYMNLYRKDTKNIFFSLLCFLSLYKLSSQKRIFKNSSLCLRYCHVSFQQGYNNIEWKASVKEGCYQKWYNNIKGHIRMCTVFVKMKNMLNFNKKHVNFTLVYNSKPGLLFFTSANKVPSLIYLNL